MSAEIWKAIPGYEGSYEVSDLGRVRSLDRVLTSDAPKRGYPRRARGKVLAPQLSTAGYSQVGLSGKIHLVPWLVLLAFKGERPPGEEACHNNGRKRDDRLENLRWGTHVDNCADRVAHGTNCEGEKNGGAKLTSADVLAIRAAKGRRRRIDLAADFGIHPHHVTRLQKRERWAHL